MQPEFPGRILRLFRRGHQEEPNIIADLKAIGIEVRDLQNQDRVDFGSHVSGSIDAIIDGGVPEAPKKPHIGEFKTHSLKSFNKLNAEGVQKAKPEHYAAAIDRSDLVSMQVLRCVRVLPQEGTNEARQLPDVLTLDAGAE